MPKPVSNGGVDGNPWRIRDVQASALTEIWLVSAVVTILVIRGYLQLTGYPQVGEGTLHISHVLWGGLGMVLGFGVLIIFAHPAWKLIASVIAGAGFGAFIDELGKFLTNDYDYFYRPTIAIIYAVIVALFLVARYLDEKRKPTEADHLFHAVQGLQWQAIGKLDRRRQRAAIQHLDASGNSSPFAEQVRSMLMSAELVDDEHRSGLLAYQARMSGLYWKIVDQRWLERIVVGLFIFKGVQILGSAAIGIANGSFDVGDGLSFSEWGTIIAATVGGGLAFLAVVKIVQHDRVAALRFLVGSILCAVLFSQFFAFVSIQLIAMGNLVTELIILGALRFALTVENSGNVDDEPPDEHRSQAIRG